MNEQNGNGEEQRRALEESNKNKKIVMDQIRGFHKSINEYIMDHRLEYCPLAVVSALTMLTHDLTKALSLPEMDKIMDLCNELYPELALVVSTGMGPREVN